MKKLIFSIIFTVSILSGNAFADRVVNGTVVETTHHTNVAHDWNRGEKRGWYHHHHYHH